MAKFGRNQRRGLAPIRHSRLNAVVVMTLGAVLVTGAGCWSSDQKPKPRAFVGAGNSTTATTPEKSASSPLRVDPAEFVGSQVCAECHRPQFESYLQTAHSQAFMPIDLTVEPPDGQFHHDASGRDYEIVRRDGQLLHRELLRDDQGNAAAQDERVLKWLVGSGRHSRTYLVEADGFLSESPVTWYASRQAWSMSPGYEHARGGGFERPADAGCLYCHVGRIEAVDGALHHLQFHEAAIGCERCHGPGAGHTARHRGAPLKGETLADRIVQPASLTREQQDDVCAQCHLRGDATVPLSGRTLESFQPGMRLTHARIDYHIETPGAPMKVVGHVEQMRLSACYQNSDTLTCITCHAPHTPVPPSEQVSHYRQSCVSCHAEQGCAMDETQRLAHNENHCAGCHMPQVETDIPHIAFTHHRIGVHGQEPAAPTPKDAITRLAAHGDLSHLSERERDRGLGLAYLEAADKQPSAAAREAYQRRAHELLETTLARGGDDGEVKAALARLYWLEHPQQAVTYAEAALRDERLSAGARANALVIVGDLLWRDNQPQAAVRALEQLVGVRRIAHDYLLLAECRSELDQLDAAWEAAQTALAIDPFRAETHTLLATLARQRGDAKQAEQHRQKAAELEKLQP
jgi:hypothetical protein